MKKLVCSKRYEKGGLTNRPNSKLAGNLSLKNERQAIKEQRRLGMKLEDVTLNLIVLPIY